MCRRPTLTAPYYLDRDIRDTTGDQVPYNKNLLDARNYERIEDLL
jgi:hypothetical protein